MDLTNIEADKLAELQSEGKIMVTKKGKIVTPEEMGLVVGKFHGTQRGFGFVSTSKTTDSDIFIPRAYVNTAMHGDTVLCCITKGSEGKNRCEGEIFRVIRRAATTMVGCYYRVGKRGFVLADNNKIDKEIVVRKKDTMGAVAGHKVVVKITKFGEDFLEGKIVEILGHINDPGVDILSIIRQHNIPVDFPKEVMNETEDIPDEVKPEDIQNRVDLRQLTMVTIDCIDSKDLDDAVSLEILDNGNFKLGVHIADVTHYVKHNSPLDKEALKRGTSVYLVDRVIPMLPHKLSNGICSLNPQVDRLALSCIMEIDASGNVVDHEICESVINVNERMTYEVVADLLTNENSEYHSQYADFLTLFKNMERLCDILREKRITRGAIEFDFPESLITVDKDGKPTNIEIRSRNIATGIIEEFMLACNETVAEHYFWLELPFVYRTHEEPDQEKMQKLAIFVNNHGYTMKGHGRNPRSIQALLSKIESTPEETVISRVVLRSMKQARYSEQNIGHFGLAAKHYCHFTSPIRRYPDLQIHRIIKGHINRTLSDSYINYLKDKIEDIAKQCSVTERKAVDCEREVESLKKAQYMEDKVGCVFTGIITGITQRGIYVELPNTVEGMVSVSTLEGDYTFDERSMKLIGPKTYSFGDKVEVELVRVSIANMNIDFEFTENNEDKSSLEE